MSNNLHLEFKFTDRGGRDVYEIFNAEDNKRMLKPLGTIRIPTVLGDPVAVIEWTADEEEKDANDRLADDYKPEQLELDV